MQRLSEHCYAVTEFLGCNAGCIATPITYIPMVTSAPGLGRRLALCRA